METFARVNAAGVAPTAASLFGAQLDGKDCEEAPLGRRAPTLTAASLWNLSSSNLASAEQLVTLQHIAESGGEQSNDGASESASPRLLAKLRERAAAADNALRIKALQVSEYERELGLVHAKLAELEAKNETLHADFERKLQQFEHGFGQRRVGPRAAFVARLRETAPRLRTLRAAVAETAAAFGEAAVAARAEFASLEARVDAQRLKATLCNRRACEAETAALSKTAELESERRATAERLSTIRRLRARLAFRRRLAKSRQTSAARAMPRRGARCRSHPLPRHPCLEGRSLCRRRAYIEGLKRAFGL